MNGGQLLKQANRLQRMGKLDEAISIYHQVIEINPNFAWTYYYLGDVFAKQKNLDEAVTNYQCAIDINPNLASFYQSLGETLLQQGKLKDAMAILQKASSINTEFSKKLSKLKNKIVKQFLTKAEKLNKDGIDKEAIEYFREAIAVNSEQSILVYCAYGDCLIKLQKFPEAEAIFGQIIQKYPKHLQGYKGYARVAAQTQKWELALTRWQTAIDKFPQDIGLQVQKGNVLINLCRFDEAEAVFLQLIENYPKHPQGYDGYGRVARGLGNWELALERWENAIHQLPQHFNFYVQKGNALINLSRYQEAEILFEEVTTTYPNHHQGYDGLARVSMQAQQWELALTRWQTAIDKFPNNLAFLAGKVNAYIELHRFDLAQDWVDRIFRDYPNHHQAYSLQERLLLVHYKSEDSLAILTKIETYIKSFLSNQEAFQEKLLETIYSFCKTLVDRRNSFTTTGITGIVVQRMLDDHSLEVFSGEILVCTFRKLIIQKLGGDNLCLKQGDELCTQANFCAAIDIYLNLVDDLVEEFIPDYPEHIDIIFSEQEEEIKTKLLEKYGSLELAKEAVEADLINGDFPLNGIDVKKSVYKQDVYIKFGHALVKLGQKEAAFANYRHAIKLNLALALLGATLIEWSISRCQQLINSGCHKLGIYQQLSSLLVKQGLPKQTREIAHQARTHFGSEYHSQKIMTSILELQGNKQQALEHYQQVLKANPQTADKNFGVLIACENLEKFEKQIMLGVMLSDKYKIAYAVIPKCACTTVRTTMKWLENVRKDESKIISMPKHQAYRVRRVKIENLAANYFKFVVVREPIKRFLSAFSNKILHARIFERSELTTSQYLSITNLGVNPEINWLIHNLELYLEMSTVWKDHIKPQYAFMGNQIKGFDRIFQVERLWELGEKLSEVTGFEVKLPRLNTRGRKISLAELSEKSMEKLINFYAKDYELLNEYYSPEKIWEEYKSLKG